MYSFYETLWILGAKGLRSVGIFLQYGVVVFHLSLEAKIEELTGKNEVLTGKNEVLTAENKALIERLLDNEIQSNKAAGVLLTELIVDNLC